MTPSVSTTNDVIRGLIEAAREARTFALGTSKAIVTSERVARWVQRVTQLLEMAQHVPLEELGPDHGRIDNLQQRFKLAARTLLGLPCLDEPTRSDLCAFASAPPQYITSPYRLTYDSFSSRIPQWERNLQRFVGIPNIHFLEIGSFQGHSACWLLTHVLTHESSTLTCVDLFHPSYKHLFGSNIAMTGAVDRVKAITGGSATILPSLMPSRYDFIYLDATHDQVNVLEDAVLAWRVLKLGGLLTFDDYLLKDAPLTQILFPARPDIGIDAFLSTYEGRYQVVSRGYQITIEKLTDTAPVGITAPCG